MRASAGGLLVLQGAGGGKFLNTGGRIEAQDGSTVSLVGIAAVVGGELEATGSGRFLVGPNQNGVLEDVSLTGKFDVLNNSDLELKGTINNMGHIELANQGNATDIQIAGNVSVEGGGTITLGGSSGNSRILDEVGTAGVFTNVDNTIQGQGSIGFNRTQIVNQAAGTITANVSGQTLTLDNFGAAVTNQGSLTAENGGRFFVADELTNEGTVAADTASLVDVNLDLINTSTGLLAGNGEIEAASIQNDGRIGPGASVGALTLDANVNFGSASNLEIEIDSSGADLLSVTGNLDLDGVLQIELLSGFAPADSDTFEIVVANSLSGAFSNVANGETISTIDGGGTFVVNYGVGSNFDENSVVLSNFTAIPEPGGCLAVLLLAVIGISKRRTRNSS